MSIPTKLANRCSDLLVGKRLEFKVDNSGAIYAFRGVDDNSGYLTLRYDETCALINDRPVAGLVWGIVLTALGFLFALAALAVYKRKRNV